MGKINANGNGIPTGGLRNWGKLSPKQKLETALDASFKCFVFPSALVSAFSSISSFLLTNLFGYENEYLDKTAEYSNKAAYFLNGIYGGVDNSYSKNTPGALGYALVALSSIIGTKENMYLLKGPGTAFDQLPAMLVDVAYNPSVIERYKLKKGEEEEFNKYSSFWDSTEKTLFSTWFVCKDIVNEFRKNLSKGFFKAISQTLMYGERVAEKNLVITSLGVLAGCGLAIFPALRKIGRSIRDIFGAHADMALFAKGFSYSKEGKKTGVGNFRYMICGALYEIGSVFDFIYNWTGLNKLELAAVGFDNAGMLFMNWANATDNQASRNGTVDKQKAAA